MSTKRFLRSVLAVLCLLFASAAPQRALAANPSDEGCNQDDECRALFQKGKTLYKQQDYTSALMAFKSAYERRQTPILLANIGRTLQKLGRPKEALEYYLRCQEAAKTDTDLQEKLSLYIAETRALLGETSDPKDPRQPKDQVEPAPAPLSEPLTPVEKPKPLHKRGWFIAVMVAGSVVVAGAITTGIIFGTRPSPMPDPPLDPDVTIVRPMF